MGLPFWVHPSPRGQDWGLLYPKAELIPTYVRIPHRGNRIGWPCFNCSSSQHPRAFRLVNGLELFANSADTPVLMETFSWLFLSEAAGVHRAQSSSPGCDRAAGPFLIWIREQRREVKWQENSAGIVPFWRAPGTQCGTTSGWVGGCTYEACISLHSPRTRTSTGPSPTAVPSEL